MKQQLNKSKIFEAKLSVPPSFGQSIIEIAKIIGPNFEYKQTLSQKGEKRQFKDEKGYFGEMSNGKKKGEKTIAE